MPGELVSLLCPTTRLVSSLRSDQRVKGGQNTPLFLPPASPEIVAPSTDAQKGFYNDFVTVELLCGAADIVINAATSDDLELTKSINLGLEQGRHNGRRGVLVHISGTQVIESEPTGKLEGVTKYDVSSRCAQRL